LRTARYLVTAWSFPESKPQFTALFGGLLRHCLLC
jgi:hypothetical protein